jgi:tRNA(Ile)-lysidine synthase
MGGVSRQGVPWPGAVAVSGGGDSVALLLLLADWARAEGLDLPLSLTVDHGLRPGSAQEASEVAGLAAGWGLKAQVLSWRGRKPKADIEAAARDARYRLMGDWCRAHRMRFVYVAHTEDDQAETFLLRLARGSGVDGLAAMSAVSPVPAAGCEMIQIVRPLLEVPRSRLRTFLRARGIPWVDDTMNTDPRFSRARLRAAWPTLECLGLSARRIAGAARHLSRARAALEQDTDALLADAARFVGRQVFLDAGHLASAPNEIGLRALARVLMQVSGQARRPRFERLMRLYAAIRAAALGGGRTLHGCCIGPAPKRECHFGPGTLRISREAARPVRTPAR